MLPLRRQVVPVFLMHRFTDSARGVCGHSPELLDQALNYLHTHGHTVISLRQIVQAMISGSTLPDNSVAFTIDDGFYDQAEVAVPIFEHYDAPVTIFLATDMQQKQHWSWDYQLEYLFKYTDKNTADIDLGKGTTTINFETEQKRQFLVDKLQTFYKGMPGSVTEKAIATLSEVLEVNLPAEAPPEYEAISWEQARKLESNLIEFGPHSKSHHILARLDDHEAKDEIIGSWHALRKNLRNPVPVFCFPSGRLGFDFGLREQRLVSDAGLLAALSADPGYVYLHKDKPDNLFRLKRFAFPDSFTDFKQYCSWLEYAKERFRAYYPANDLNLSVSMSNRL